MERVSLFDAIDSNKRNSVLLILVMSAIFAGAIFGFSFLFGINPIITSVIGCFALFFYAIITYFAGDRVILALSGAKEAKKEDYPFLYNVVEGLSLASQIPMPKLYVIDDRAPNAFATGRDPKHASVAVTTGLLDIMSRQELEGVIAHEISHIGNYDIRFMMLAVVFVGAIGLLANIGVRTFLWTGGNHRDRKGGSGLAILGLIFLILAPVFAMIVRLAISRQREYLADATAAKLTRYPEGLASALEKISGNAMPTKNASDTTASLYISNPFPKKMSFLGSTHPSIEDRVKRLRAM
ncbi:M48 family metallopeptidase [Candidatus Micrarchaeota archaeon]|nr:M48 family metallopeptidase [Candidatus Micrarchaeota archaeon]